MKQTVLFDSCFKNYFQAEKKIEKVFDEIRALSEKGKEYLKSYEYILACTDVYNASSEDDVIARFFLLSSFKEGVTCPFENKDQAFTAFYLVCFHYYRTNDGKCFSDVLSRYVGEGEFRFSVEDYPMIWELSCRYSHVVEDYERQLLFARIGAKEMPENPALGVSYASSLCERTKNAYYKNLVTPKLSCPDYLNDKSFTLEENISFEESLIHSFEYVIAVKNKNPKYAKYYFLFAELLFYARIRLKKAVENGINDVIANSFVSTLKKEITEVELPDLLEDDAFTRRNVEKYVSLAKGFASTEEEKSKYNQFLDLATAYFNKRPNGVFARKNKIITSTSFEDCLDAVRFNCADDYVTISYSRKDYKPVLCDVVELQSRGAQVVFDEKLDETNDSDGQTWDEKYFTILKKSKLVICFLSENYLSSGSVYKELKMIKSLNKPVIAIDLTRKKMISEIIKSAINKGVTLSSDALRSVVEVFDDDKLVFVREKNPDAVLHFDKLESALKNQCGEVFKTVTSSVLQTLNQSPNPHPQEDGYYVNDIDGVYLVCDGITRQEGYADENYSVSAAFTNKFCKNFGNALAEDMQNSVKNLSQSIKKVFVKSSVSVYEQLTKENVYADNYSAAKALSIKRDKYFEPVGCVAALAVIENGTLYYGRVGDCGVLLARNGELIKLTSSQTRYAFKIDGVEKERRLLYEKYVNRPENQRGYGVVNGDKNVSAFFNISQIKLERGDVVYVASDGILDFLADEYLSFFDDLDLEEIFKLQKDRLTGTRKLDDRTLIRIKY